MIYAEVVVNVPIRRTFSRRHTENPPPEPGEREMDGVTGRQGFNLQAFHYHIPVELEAILQAGHLVWVPFGRQEVQGFVVQLTTDSPVDTKPIARLARPKPILTETQLKVAHWIAETYVASLAEALKLFLPPGMLSKPDQGNKLRAKREWQIELLINEDAIDPHLASLARDTPQIRVLDCLVAHPQAQFTKANLQKICQLKSDSTLKTLANKNILQMDQEAVRLLLPHEEARHLLQTLQGIPKYRPVLDALLNSGRPLWKTELYELVSTDLNILRSLQSAGCIHMTEKIRFRDPLAGRAYATTTGPTLTGEQARVWQMVLEQGFAYFEQSPQARKKSPPKFLLHGVTGSGKTEIYLRTIERTLTQGRQAIVLVPEIALTPQTVARFAGRFPGRVTVIHSELSQGQRYDVWRSIRDGDFDVVVGPRSALFAPLPRLGLIVIDEEHESSYKQSAEAWGSFTIFYDARAVAEKMAEQTNSLLILGSATPSLDIYYETSQNRYTLLEMPRRVLAHAPQPTSPSKDDETASQPKTIYAELPPVEIIDLRQELRAGNRRIFSRRLQTELNTTLEAGEQAILFLNRRGTHTFVMCRDCGEVMQCSRCDVPLTYHERASELLCHHCNQREPIPNICPNTECGSRRIKYFGSGTQRLEELVLQIAPQARILRWDADTTGRKGSHEAILNRFANQEANVLVGTQMIAKGLDLPMVTLVGVISADVGLYLPDFRSGERTFQLLTQVAGRAGRSERGGRVIFQTYTPEHYAIQAAAQHDYKAFYEREIGFRQEHRYPPIRRMARLIYWDKKREKVEEEAKKMVATLKHQLGQLGIAGEHVDIMGPAPAFFARYRDYYRWQILLRAPDPATLLKSISIPFGWRIDIDPVSML